MAELNIIDPKTIAITVTLEDALAMVQEAAAHVEQYAADIVVIFEKMPVFHYTHFCFYAFDSAALFEWMLKEDPKQYLSFSLNAPESFFYTLYGGMAALYPQAKQLLADVPSGEAHLV